MKERAAKLFPLEATRNGRSVAMRESSETFGLEVRQTIGKSPIGEKVGTENLAQGKIPMLSCDGACIQGEIARVAANLVAKQEPYRRGCYGELFAVPDSALPRRTGFIKWPQRRGRGSETAA
jgi:hypothetical protein